MNSISNLLNNSIDNNPKKPNLQLTQAFVYYEISKAVKQTLVNYPEVAEYLIDLKIAVNSKAKTTKTILPIESSKPLLSGINDIYNFDNTKNKDQKIIEVIFSSPSSTFRTFLKLNAPDIKDQLSSQPNFKDIEFVFIFR